MAGIAAVARVRSFVTYVENSGGLPQCSYPKVSMMNDVMNALIRKNKMSDGMRSDQDEERANKVRSSRKPKTEVSDKDPDDRLNGPSIHDPYMAVGYAPRLGNIPCAFLIGTAARHVAIRNPAAPAHCLGWCMTWKKVDSVPDWVYPALETIPGTPEKAPEWHPTVKHVDDPAN